MDQPNEQFSWTDDSVIFPTMLGIAVYLNNSGSLVIRQEGEYGEDDSVIVIDESQIKRFAMVVSSYANL